jgi:integrase
MKRKQVWFRDFDGWFYGQVGKGLRRKQQRILEGPDTPARRRKAQKKYEQLLDDGVDVSADTRLRQVFISFLRKHANKRCSAETFAWYRYYLKEFARKHGTLRLKQLTPAHVEDWLDQPKKRQWVSKKTRKVIERRFVWGDTTRNRAITCVKAAVNWFCRRARVRDNPLAALVKPPIARRDRLLKPEEKRQILRSVRDAAFRQFVFAMMGTGARPCEIRTVTAAEFLPEPGLWVFPPKRHKTGKKTGKPRVVYLTPPLVKLCRQLAGRRPEGPLFRNTRGNPWTRNAVRIRFRNLRRKFPNLKGVTAYCYRHDFTTQGLLNGVSVAQMQELLGHTSPAMLAVYSHLGQQAEAMREAAAKATRRRDPPRPTA